jgi:tetratricopeptide (TPR) repeat protein
MLKANKEAAADLTRAIELGTDGWGIWAQRGEVWLDLDDGVKAVSDISKAIELKADDFWIWNGRGRAFEKQRQWAKARTDFTHAALRSPHLRDGWVNRGRMNAELGQWESAMADFREAIKREPDNAWSWHYLGMAQLGGGDRAGYRRTCVQMVERFKTTARSGNADAVAYLGVLLPDAVPDVSVLVKLSKRAVESGDNAIYRESLGAAYYRAGRIPEAVQELEKAMKAEGATVWMQLFLAMAHHRRERGETPAALAVPATQAVGLLDSPWGRGPLLAASMALAVRPQARFWLTRAVQEIESRTFSWDDRLRWQILRPEAEELLKDNAR